MKKFLRSIVVAYLTFLTKNIVSRFKSRFIVVTGSAGKTTTKMAIFNVLKVKYRDKIATSYGSMGTVIGLPLALLDIKPSWVDRNEVGPPTWQWPGWLVVATWRWVKYRSGAKLFPRLWVVELTADQPGDFGWLLKYITPSVSVVTNVGAGHLEYFGDENGVAREKSKIVAALDKTGSAVLNYQDERVRQMARLTKAKIFWIKASGMKFAQQAARVIGELFGLTEDEIMAGLTNQSQPPHRFDIEEGPKGTILIDSTYNANPVSVMAVLEEARAIGRANGKRLVAVLGDMLELGPESTKIHQAVGETVKGLVDQLYTFGSQAKSMKADYHTDDIDELARYIVQHIRPGDTIVVKGSHGMRLDRLVDKLKGK